ncbi:MAG: murein biosynthesis integral membrane protein MurJ [Pyrinomonadaceae bacterium]|nr:murein biosynthesis integral membrane protein MurJ [Pyrinomonadaceae bacterium]
MSDLQNVDAVAEEPEELTGPTAEEIVEAEPPRQQSVARSAGIVSIAVMFSRVLGLVRETIFARYFGAGFLYDAFIVGFRIPNLLRDLFAEGALSAAFVKVFTDYQLKNSEKEAWRLASLIFNGLAVVLSVICIAGVLLSPLFVKLITYNYLGDPNHYYPAEKAALATTLMQIMFPFILLVALAALAMGVLNTKGRFGIPASASTAFNVVSVVFGLGLAFWLSGGAWERSVDKITIPSDAAQWAIIGMSIGTLLGGAAQLLIQVPSLFKVGFRFSFALSFTDPGVRRVMRLMAPAIIGTGAIQIKVLVDTVVASGIDGGASWLSYAFRLMQFPIGVFGVAIGTAAIPTLSRLASEENILKFRSTLSDAIKLVFLLAIPSACGLIVLGEPIISLIYQRGEFTAFDTNMTAWALTAYSIGLAGYAAIKVLSPAFYALDDAKTPMYLSLASILVHVPTSFGMMQLLSTVGVSPERPNGFGHVGVALATSVVSIVTLVVLAFFMRRKIKRLNGRDLMSAFVRIVIASAAMSAVAYLSYRVLAGYLGAKILSTRLIEVFVPIALAGVTFLIAAKLLRIQELEQILGSIRKKLSI